MVFKLNFDGNSVSCSSALCVQRLLGRGWRLTDPSQAEELLRTSEAEKRASQRELQAE